MNVGQSEQKIEECELDFDDPALDEWMSTVTCDQLDQFASGNVDISSTMQSVDLPSSSQHPKHPAESQSTDDWNLHDAQCSVNVNDDSQKLNIDKEQNSSPIQNERRAFTNN